MSETKAPKIIARAIGRRKEATASVRLTSGDGKITVNDLPVEKYFPGIVFKSIYTLPFTLTAPVKYSATVRILGGGLLSQSRAMVLGLSRALSGLKPEFKISLRNAGLLTRDPRERQRRMVGTGGKARRRKQSPKR